MALSNTQMKKMAQEALLESLNAAFYKVFEGVPPQAHEQIEELCDVMDGQMERIEKLFGYEPGTFMRGQ